MEEILRQLSVWIIPILLAVTLHEAAHGIVAWRLGDDTAFRLGRVSLNPLRHVDPVGTVLMPAALLFMSSGQFMFGYAKPVPVNFGNLKSPRRDMMLVALAGPGANIVLAIAAALLSHVLPLLPLSFAEWLAQNLFNLMWINIILAIFNMVPLPPLDGGRVAVGLLPLGLARTYARLERFGFAIILGLLFVVPYVAGRMGFDFDPLRWIILGPARMLLNVLVDAFWIVG